MPFLSNLLWCVLVFAAFGFSVCLHEFGHALIDYWGGDHSVKDKGYLTLNPLRYTDATTSLTLPLIFLVMGGIPLPGAAVYINHTALRSRAWESAVSAAGPFATLLVTVFLTGAIALIPESNTLLYEGTALLLTLQIAAAFLNLLPMPGLDGFGIIEPWLPASWQSKLRPVRKFGIWILFGLFWTVPAFSQGFWASVVSVAQFCGVSPATFGLGLSRFQVGATFLFLVLIAGLIGYKQWEKRQPGYVDSAKAQQNRPYTQEELRAALTNTNQTLATQETVANLSTKAALLLRLQQYDDALTTVEQAISLHDHSDGLPETNFTYTHLLSLKSNLFFYQQRYTESLQIINKILATEPQNQDAAYNKACCHAKLGQLDLGLAALTTALTNNTALHKQAKADEDLDALKAHPDYATLVG